jgi:hypothetical protein
MIIIMRFIDHELMPSEYGSAEDALHLQLGEREDYVLRRVVWRQLVNAASSDTIIMAIEEANDCLRLLSLPPGFAVSVGFPISNEFATHCADALYKEAAAFPDEADMKLAYELSDSIRHELQA